MRATLQFLQEKFEEFNRTVFAGALPRVTIGVFHARRRLGELRYPRYSSGRRPAPEEYTIRISDYFDMEQAALEDTLIHEMIHLYIHWFDIPDRSAHGPAFRKMAAAINRRHGRHITVTRPLSDSEKESDTRLSWHYIVLVTLSNGERLVCVCASTRIFEIHTQLGMQPNVSGWEWRISYDPFFNHFPRCRRLAYYKISPEEIDAHIHGEMSRPCVCDGRIFKVADA